MCFRDASFCSHQELTRLYGKEQYTLYMAKASAIPQYDKGSLGSVVLDFRIGFIMHLFHREGIMPLSKQMLNSICKKEESKASLHKTLHSIASMPHAFPFQSCLRFFTSKIDICFLNIGSSAARCMSRPSPDCPRSEPSTYWQFSRELKVCFHLSAFPYLTDCFPKCDVIVVAILRNIVLKTIPM